MHFGPTTAGYLPNKLLAAYTVHAQGTVDL